jgi:hypothetical protein
MQPKERLEEEGKKHLRRGDRFIERDQYTEALSEYVTGFNKLCMSWSIEVQGDITNSAGRLKKYSGEIIVDFWFAVVKILKRIMGCYDSLEEEGRYKLAFLVQNVLDIIDGVSPYEKDMSVEQLDFYEELKEEMDGYKNLFTIQLEKISKGEGDQYFDDQLKEVYESLNYLCKKEPVSIFPKRKIPGASSDCFIATAVYETSQHPDLDVFRDFRDNQLLTNSFGKWLVSVSFGKWLVSVYYEIGPSLAKYIASQPKLKDFTHQKLKNLAQWMRK